MMIDEDLFPLVASINIASTNSRALLNAKKAERFSPSVKIRKVWIPKKYLVYMDDLTVRRIMYVTRERKKNGRYPYYLVENSKKKIKKKKLSKGNDIFPKETHASPRKKASMILQGGKCLQGL